MSFACLSFFSFFLPDNDSWSSSSLTVSSAACFFLQQGLQVLQLLYRLSREEQLAFIFKQQELHEKLKEVKTRAPTMRMLL
tara:strand:- start:431 stop:673 length:243 start_codon:yes stop_codon:yes gene_type:complete